MTNSELYKIDTLPKEPQLERKGRLITPEKGRRRVLSIGSDIGLLATNPPKRTFFGSSNLGSSLVTMHSPNGAAMLHPSESNNPEWTARDARKAIEVLLNSGFLDRNRLVVKQILGKATPALPPGAVEPSDVDLTRANREAIQRVLRELGLEFSVLDSGPPEEDVRMNLKTGAITHHDYRN